MTAYMNNKSDPNSESTPAQSSVANSRPSELDRQVVELLRRNGAMRISELTEAIGVTATAVRQRLNRLMESQLVDRQAETAGRGRPSHRYLLTEAGRRTSGSNFADLAVALWDEIRSIQDIEIRRGLLERLSKRMAAFYSDKITGDTPAAKMQSVADLLADREVPFEVTMESGLPVLQAVACPYTELAEQDRFICSMEKMLFSELVGQNLTLSQCRLDDKGSTDGSGGGCCTFELN